MPKNIERKSKEFLVVDKKDDNNRWGRGWGWELPQAPRREDRRWKQKFSPSSYSQIEKHTNEFSFNYLEHSPRRISTSRVRSLVCLFVCPRLGSETSPETVPSQDKQDEQDEQETGDGSEAGHVEAIVLA